MFLFLVCLLASQNLFPNCLSQNPKQDWWHLLCICTFIRQGQKSTFLYISLWSLVPHPSGSRKRWTEGTWEEPSSLWNQFCPNLRLLVQIFAKNTNQTKPRLACFSLQLCTMHEVKSSCRSEKQLQSGKFLLGRQWSDIFSGEYLEKWFDTPLQMVV